MYIHIYIYIYTHTHTHTHTPFLPCLQAAETLVKLWAYRLVLLGWNFFDAILSTTGVVLMGVVIATRCNPIAGVPQVRTYCTPLYTTVCSCIHVSRVNSMFGIPLYPCIVIYLAILQQIHCIPLYPAGFSCIRTYLAVSSCICCIRAVSHRISPPRVNPVSSSARGATRLRACRRYEGITTQR